MHQGVGEESAVGGLEEGGLSGEAGHARTNVFVLFIEIFHSYVFLFMGIISHYGNAPTLFHAHSRLLTIFLTN